MMMKMMNTKTEIKLQQRAHIIQPQKNNVSDTKKEKLASSLFFSDMIQFDQHFSTEYNQKSLYS
jgi:hypothetical protein